MTQVDKVNWTRTTIVFALRKKGTTAAGLAKAAGLARSTFYMGLEAPYPHVHRIISGALGVPQQEIWPQFYDERGRRRRLQRSIRRSAA